MKRIKKLNKYQDIILFLKKRVEKSVTIKELLNECAVII